jgi:hypothetical protein
MTTLDDLEKLSLVDFAKVFKRNFKLLLKDKPKMKAMMKIYSKKLDEMKKPDTKSGYEIFMKGGETDGNIKFK